MENDAGKGHNAVSATQGGIDNRTLDPLKKGRNITILTLSSLCRILDFTPNEIVEIEKE